MDPHDTTRPTRPDVPRATAPPTRTFGPQGPTLGDLIDAYLQDYLVRQFRSHSIARGRTAHLTAFFGRAARAAALTTHQIRQYQLARRAAGAATGTINRETSALHRMGTLAVHWGWLDTVPGFPDRLRENPPRQGFFEHPEYLAVRAHLPAPWQDILDLAYYSGWRKQEILGLTWEEIDEAGGVIRLSPARSKTLVGRILPISPPIADALNRRRARRDPDSPLVFHRDGITIRRWRTAWRTACQAAGVPTRFLHDCRRTAARNLIRANVPELVAYLAQQAQAVPARRRPHAAGPAATRPRAGPPPRATHHRIRAHGPPVTASGRGPGGGAGGSPDTARLCAGDGIQAPDPEYGPACNRGTRGDGAGRRGRPRARTSPDRGSTPALRPLVSARDQSALRRPGPRDRSPRSSNHWTNWPSLTSWQLGHVQPVGAGPRTSPRDPIGYRREAM